MSAERDEEQSGPEIDDRDPRAHVLPPGSSAKSHSAGDPGVGPHLPLGDAIQRSTDTTRLVLVPVDAHLERDMDVRCRALPHAP